jgi:hypothetical protein
LFAASFLVWASTNIVQHCITAFRCSLPSERKEDNVTKVITWKKYTTSTILSDRLTRFAPILSISTYRRFAIFNSNGHFRMLIPLAVTMFQDGVD